MQCHDGVCVPMAPLLTSVLDEKNKMADKQVFRDSSGRHTRIVEKNPAPERLSYLQLANQLTKNAVANSAEMHRAMNAADPPIPGNDPYFGFVPVHIGELHYGSSLNWTAPCFGQTSAKLSGPADKPLTITLELSKKSGLVCEDHYLFMTVSSWHHDSYLLSGKHTLVWHELDALELSDVATAGIRIYRFRTAMPTVISDIYATAKLFLGAETGKPNVPEATAADNLKFLQDYANMSFPARSETAGATVLGPDQVDIQSGDLLGIIRFDGLDPLIAWGTGNCHLNCHLS